MGAAKAAMESVVRYFAVALASRGITVNAVSPGVTDDRVLSGLSDPVVQTARQWHAGGLTRTGRMGTPADVGDVVAFLCAREAGWITGQLIHADGGASLADTHLPLELQRG
jgi:NAD(P)-dependent dehydrogenase (short-subunit alcohol dehydrogenase family)